MKIIVNNVRFNVTADDLVSAKAHFSFWNGRRFSFIVNDDQQHFLRYNDILKAALAEDATFDEGEDHRRIYTALNGLKDRGYPYSESYATQMMLCLKQFFGNYYREELLNQLNNKLEEFIYNNHDLFNTDEYENESEETISDNTLTSCSKSLLDIPHDILLLISNYVGRAGCLPLSETCKVFSNIYENNTHLKSYLRDYYFIREHYFLRNSKEFLLTYIEKNKIYLLLNEFNINKVNFDPDANLYERLHYAIALAKIDPKNALKIVCPIIKRNEDIEIQALAFCVIAGIHKNSTLCKEDAVLQMGARVANDYQQTWRSELMNEDEGTRLCNLLNLFEAFLGLDNECAIKILSVIDLNHHNNIEYLESNLTKILKMIKRLYPFEEKIQEKIANLLIRLVDSVKILPDDEAIDLIIKISKVYALFDQNKAIEILENTLIASHSDLNLEEDDNNTFVTLATFACAFTKLDLKRAFILAKEAFQIFEKIKVDDHHCLHSLFKSFAATDKEFALEKYEKIKNQIPSSDLNQLFNKTFPISNIEEVLDTLGAFALRSLIDRQGALNIAKEYASGKKMPENKNDNLGINNNHLIAILIAKLFPEEAIEIINKLDFGLYGNIKSNFVIESLPEEVIEIINKDAGLYVTTIKSALLIEILKKKLNSKIARSYIEQNDTLVYLKQ